jgi:hypothetical protein
MEKLPVRISYKVGLTVYISSCVEIAKFRATVLWYSRRSVRFIITKRV